MTADEEEKFYQSTRRASMWIGSLLECELITQECRKDLTAWMGTIPESWWPRFDVDDAAEAKPCESAN
jgi:hypothetical protein